MDLIIRLMEQLYEEYARHTKQCMAERMRRAYETATSWMEHPCTCRSSSLRQ